MSSIKVFFRGVGVMVRVSPGSFITIFQHSLKSLVPFINIYFTSVILLELTGNQDVPRLIRYVAFAVGANFIARALTNILDIQATKASSILWNEDLNIVSRAMLALDFETLEDTATHKKLNELKEFREHNGSCIEKTLMMFASWAQGLTGVAISVYFLWPLMSTLFVRTGETFFHSPWFSIAVLGSILAAAAIVLVISAKSNQTSRKVWDEIGKRSRIYRHYLAMVNDYNTGKEIRVFQQQKMIHNHATRDNLSQEMPFHRKLCNVQTVASGAFVTIGALVGFGVYILIGTQGLLGLFDVGSLVRYTGAFLQIVAALIAIGENTGHLARIIPGLHRYFAVVDLSPNIEPGMKNPKGLGRETISFENVTFHYSKAEKNALKDVSLTIQPGEKLAVVGENGSGKTTFIKLLTRMYLPSDGKITLAGQNTAEFKPEAYRKLFTVVFQDFKLFAFPLGENVAVDANYDEQQVRNCLKAADFGKRLASLDHGLETILYKDTDEDGVEVSGGEAQKIALARALYTNADILILDEPTAALDPIAEYKLYQDFNNLAGAKTAIYISHRLSSCRFCDRIAVFDKGRLVQLGTHNELIEDEEGKYYELWMAQAQYYV